MPMRSASHHYLSATALSAMALAGTAGAATIRVPADQPTIQEAIVAAQAGDKVLVAPGTYRERLDFLGKPIEVVSEAGPQSTIVDAEWKGNVVRFLNGEPAQARLSGFTLTHGWTDVYGSGAGILIGEASPTIDHNHIVNNKTGGWGGGLHVASSGTPNIHHNRIARNVAGGYGAGVQLGGFGNATLADNIIEGNTGGGGIGMWSAGTPNILRNIIRHNEGANGGGIHGYNINDPIVTGNLIYGNTAFGEGGGIYLVVPGGGGTYTNNTVVDNLAQSATQAWIGGTSADLVLVNNIFASTGAGPSIVCDTTYDTRSPQFSHNDVHSAQGEAASGSCATTAVSGTNKSVDPRFDASTGRYPYQLKAKSRLIDAGDNAAAANIKKDLAGHPRLTDGGRHGLVVDMGAYEFQPQ